MTVFKDKRLEGKKAFIFDLDGTLIDSLHYWRSFDWTKTTIEQAYEVLSKHYKTDITYKGNALEVLKKLKENNIKACIATATNTQVCGPCIERLGLYEYIEFAMCCDDVGESKRSPAIYLEAAKRLGLKPGECVVAEDMQHAAASAKAGGFFALGLYDKNNSMEIVNGLKETADLYVDRLEDIFND